MAGALHSALQDGLHGGGAVLDLALGRDGQTALDGRSRVHALTMP